MLKFNVANGKVIIDPVSLTLTSLREVWDADKTSTKEEATNILTYIHLVSQIDPDAPFAQSSFSEVEILAVRNTWHEAIEKAPIRIRWLNIYYQVNDRIDDYMQAFETADRRSEKIFNKKIDQLQGLLSDTEPIVKEQTSRTTGVTTFVSNAKILTDIMKDLSKLMDERDNLQAKIMKKRVRIPVRLWEAEENPDWKEDKDKDKRMNLIKRSDRRKAIRKIDRALLELYPEHTNLVRWWNGLHKTIQDKIMNAKKPGGKFMRFKELHSEVVSLLEQRRKLKGESKHPHGIKSTVRRHGN